jgi:hypothetical protein
MPLKVLRWPHARLPPWATFGFWVLMGLVVMAVFHILTLLRP